MRFLYKIYSNYDGFTPARLPDRIQGRGDLTLGWKRYLDDVEVGDECWVFFHGRHAFRHGVYVKGFIRAIDAEAQAVRLRVREWSADAPLTDPATTARIAAAVSTRFRQVFLWPEDLSEIPECGRDACRKHLCQDCPVWNSFRTVAAGAYRAPGEIAAKAVVPAYWLIPNRCYLYREGKRPSAWIQRVSHMFGELKLGEAAYAYPLALGIFAALRSRDLLEFDAVVPVPLSPDKIQAGELHRTLELAKHIGRQLGVPVREWLTLSGPVSKRRMQAAGFTASQFRARYASLLQANDGLARIRRVLVVDDTITRGWTLTCAAQKIHQVAPSVEVVVASAGQMILKEHVLRENELLA